MNGVRLLRRGSRPLSTAYCSEQWRIGGEQAYDWAPNPNATPAFKDTMYHRAMGRLTVLAAWYHEKTTSHQPTANQLTTIY